MVFPEKIIGLSHATVALLEIRGEYTVTPKDVRRTLSKEQIYRHFESERFQALRERVIPYLLFLDVALISLVGFYLIFVVEQSFPTVIIICFLLTLVLYPFERLLLEFYGT